MGGLAVAVLLLLSVFLSVSVVRSDYPPPEEEGHGYYSGGPRPAVERNGGGGSFVSDWSSKDWSILGGVHGQVKCLNMPSNLTLCRDVGYSEMRLPNLLQHDTLKEVTQQASTWVRLAQIRCHPDTQKFLCSLFAPICLDQPIWPCRTLCEAVKSGCENKMLRYGFPWPEMLRCDQFPEEPELCIGIQHQDEIASEVESCPACSRTNSYDAILKELCKADFVMRIKVEQSLVSDNDIKIVPSKKKKVFRTVGVKAKELRDGVVYLDGGAKCDCPPLDTVNGRRSEGQLIVAGNRTTRDRLVVSLIQAIDQQQGLRRALNDLRKKEGVCRSTDPVVHSRRNQSSGGSSGGKAGVGAAEQNKKKKKKDRKTTTAMPTISNNNNNNNNKIARPPPTGTPSSRGGDNRVSDAQSGNTGQGSQGKGKSREGRQHTGGTSQRPPKKPGHRKGQQLS